MKFAEFGLIFVWRGLTKYQFTWKNKKIDKVTKNQSNCEKSFLVWKVRNFSYSQISREINLSDWETLKTCNFGQFLTQIRYSFSTGYNSESIHFWFHVGEAKMCFWGLSLCSYFSCLFTIFQLLKTYLGLSKHILALPILGQKCIFSELWPFELAFIHLSHFTKLATLNTVWKFQDFSITQILREINFRDFRTWKPAILVFR